MPQQTRPQAQQVWARARVELERVRVACGTPPQPSARPAASPTSVIALAPLPPHLPPHDASPRSDPNTSHLAKYPPPRHPLRPPQAHPLISPPFRSNSLPLPPPRPGFRSSPRFATWVVLVSPFALPLFSIPTGESRA